MGGTRRSVRTVLAVGLIPAMLLLSNVVGGQSLAPDAGTPGAKVTFPGMEVYTPTLPAP